MTTNRKGNVATATAESASTKWWTLAAASLGLSMLLLDITTTLPDIQTQLHASLTDLQWVIDAYALSLAALLLTAGHWPTDSGADSLSPSEWASSRSALS